MKKIELACIVEDDDLHLFLINRYIELSGLVNNTLVCRNGKEAYDTLHTMFLNNEKLPEVIFLDINMPVWDGWQFLEEFVKIPFKEKLSIFILSSSQSDDDMEKAKKYNLQDNYLVKPIDINQLKTILTEI